MPECKDIVEWVLTAIIAFGGWGFAAYRDAQIRKEKRLEQKDMATQVNARRPFGGSRRFERDVPSFFHEFGDIVERLVADGNPLHAQD